MTFAPMPGQTEALVTCMRKLSELSARFLVKATMGAQGHKTSQQNTWATKRLSDVHKSNML